MKHLKLDKKESMIMGLRLSFVIEEYPVTLVSSNGQANLNPETLGKRIDFLPKCLDSKSRGVRFLTDTSELKLINEAQTSSDLVKCYPREMYFYPSDEIMQKIVM
jgi:hypothetical protein